MILIVGGNAQGKRACAERLAYEIWKTGDRTREGIELYAADGFRNSPKEALLKPLLFNFHGFVRQIIDSGADPQAYTKEVIAAGPFIVTLDEVGCGIIPVRQGERDWREACGRAGQLLGAESDQVYRVVCGILSRIK